MYGTWHSVKKNKDYEESDVCKIIMSHCSVINIALKLIAGCSVMKFTTFLTQIMFLNTMGALGIRPACYQYQAFTEAGSYHLNIVSFT